MAIAKRYYNYDKLTQFFYIPLHISIENHLADLLFNGDHSRIINAPNSYALRERVDQNKPDSGLDYPFLNFRKVDWDFDDRDKIWTAPGFYKGVYIPELQRKIRVCPIELSFEGMVWAAREDDIVYAQHLLRMDSDGRTQLPLCLTIDGIEISFLIELYHENIDLDKEYNENDWLVSNKIHTISLNFVAKTLDIIDTTVNEDLRDSTRYAITEKILFDFVAKRGLTDVTYEEALEFTVNHFSGKVE